ncbi:hypothetical protein BDZ89DRAFT_1074778 [Hymenopellis radicata]|nr:hypothetical protein BDZ89DRAFT_1074778 [Hymenopellis radicata]
MLRQSVAANRASQAPNVNSAAAVAKRREKKKEFEAVSALERASAQYLERINSLAGDFDVMADGGEVFGQVLEQWPKMFQILGLFLQSREAEENSEHPASRELARDLLVRIPIDDLQEMHSTETEST